MCEMDTRLFLDHKHDEEEDPSTFVHSAFFASGTSTQLGSLVIEQDEQLEIRVCGDRINLEWKMLDECMSPAVVSMVSVPLAYVKEVFSYVSSDPYAVNGLITLRLVRRLHADSFFAKSADIIEDFVNVGDWTDNEGASSAEFIALFGPVQVLSKISYFLVKSIPSFSRTLCTSTNSFEMIFDPLPVSFDDQVGDDDIQDLFKSLAIYEDGENVMDSLESMIDMLNFDTEFERHPLYDIDITEEEEDALKAFGEFQDNINFEEFF